VDAATARFQAVNAMGANTQRILLAAALLSVTWSALPAISDDASPALKLPVSTGQPHLCSDYPKGPKDAGIEGTAYVNLTITAEGTVTGPAIVETSGDEELDRASLACVLGWKYWPATEDGNAIPVNGNIHVSWKLPDLEFAELPRDCFAFYGVPADYPAQATEAVVTFDVSAGAVSNVAIRTSSGNGELDRNTIACAQSWRYTATDKSGAPAVRKGTERIVRWYPTPEKLRGTTNHICLNLPRTSPLENSVVLVSLTIDTAGVPRNVAVKQTSGSPAADDAAVACVSRWRYAPIAVNGKPLEVPWQAQVMTIIHR
jgi:protein TonB